MLETKPEELLGDAWFNCFVEMLLAATSVVLVRVDTNALVLELAPA